MKRTLSAIAILVVIGACLAAFMVTRPVDEPPAVVTPTPEPQPEAVAADTAPIADGTYEVSAEESSFAWAGKKPLIDGYVNVGAIAFTGGTVTFAGGTASGTVTLDMNTLSVSETPKKPGKESMLEEHLKGENWFDTATYPTAEVTITGMKPDEQGGYIVDAELTMHGRTHGVVFPASVSVDEDGTIRASAELEIDRTRWGITAGSGSFFDDLADNMIDDMIAISFTIVATPTE